MKKIVLSSIFSSLLLVFLTFNPVYADISEAVLDVHNAERESLGLEPLEWSQALATKSGDRSLGLIFTDELNEASNPQFGELVYSGQTDTISLSEMINSWMIGKDKFNSKQPTPNNCKGDKACMNYAQIVWSKTTHVGCAISSSMVKDVLVCYYDPVGNIDGEKAY